MTNVLRLCLDLNIWCAALLAFTIGKQGTASQCLVSIVRQGQCAICPVQLVISWGMLNRLRLVLEKDLKIRELDADTEVIEPEIYAIHVAPSHTLHIAHPKRMMNWLQLGQFPG